MTTSATRLCKKCSFSFPMHDRFCPSCGADQTVSSRRRRDVTRLQKFKKFAAKRRYYFIYGGLGLLGGILLPVLVGWLLTFLPPVDPNIRTPSIAEMVEPVFRFIANNALGISLGLLGASIGAALAYREHQARRLRRHQSRSSRARAARATRAASASDKRAQPPSGASSAD